MKFIAALLLFVGSAIAQQGNTITIPVHGAPGGHCSAQMLAVDIDGGTLYDCTITAGVGNWTAVGAAGTGVPGGGTNTTQYNAGGGNFGGVSAGTAGQALISNGAGSPPSFQDPIVSGPDAVGATPTKNPVQIGCLFLTTPGTLTNNQVGALQCDSTQDLLVKFINTSLAVTGTFWQATQPVSAASLPLPSGAATEATLGTLDTDVKSNVTLHAGANIIGKVTTDQTTHGTTDLVAADVTKIGGTAVVADPCQQLAKTYTPISLTANTKLLTGVSAKKYYVCEINLVVAAATNVAIVEGTGSTCGTGTAGIFGGSTAATGWNFAANDGIVLGTGGFAVGNTATNADDLCLFVSAANQVSGNIATVNF